MARIEKILICVHPKRPDTILIEHVVDVAKKFGAAVKVFHVVSEYPQDMSEWWNVRNPEKLHDKIVSEREGYLKDVAARLKKAGVKQVDYELAWGKSFLCITREVLKNHHDLVMITSRDRSKVGRMLLECPSMDLMSHCPCTLWISRGKLPVRERRVLAALSWKGGEEVCMPLNAKILRTAAALAASSTSELHVIHALPLYGGEGSKGKGLRSDLAAYVDRLRAEILEQCTSLVAPQHLSLDASHIHLITGSPASVISAFAGEHGMDVIVLGTVARTGIPGLLVGNTAAQVFDQVQASMVVVKPDDFVSLVELEESKCRD